MGSNGHTTGKAKILMLHGEWNIIEEVDLIAQQLYQVTLNRAGSLR
jgi:hypothetical protein